jgi:hypothetical protein
MLVRGSVVRSDGDNNTPRHSLLSMAKLNSVMSGPLFGLLNRLSPLEEPPAGNANPEARYRIAFGAFIVVLGLSIICFMKAMAVSGVG